MSKEAHDDPDGLNAWIGDLKAIERRYERLETGTMFWKFKFVFRKDTRLEPIEFIYNHELLHTKNTAWTGDNMKKGDTFDCSLMINSVGEVLG